MSSFRTKVQLSNYPFQIAHEDKIMCIGSCFAENMGQKLEALKFETTLNPFGILYNPISIKEALERLISAQPFEEEDLISNQELWHSFLHHGRFSNSKKEATLSKINQSLAIGHAFLQKTNRLLITFGTARVYELKSTKKVVANCHKIPAAAFTKRLLDLEEIVDSMQGLFIQLKQNNPNLEIILAVSPIRHIRDGLVENQQSKATLLLAAAKLYEVFPFVHYFPSYEIILDDLRDYRFFEEDMIHPNPLAISYIWQLFSEIFFTEETQQLLKRIEKIQIAAHHRPFHPNTMTHQSFIKTNLEKIKNLSQQFPRLSFEEEIATFKSSRQ